MVYRSFLSGHAPIQCHKPCVDHIAHAHVNLVGVSPRTHFMIISDLRSSQFRLFYSFSSKFGKATAIVSQKVCGIMMLTMLRNTFIRAFNPFINCMMRFKSFRHTFNFIAIPLKPIFFLLTARYSL